MKGFGIMLRRQRTVPVFVSAALPLDVVAPSDGVATAVGIVPPEGALRG